MKTHAIITSIRRCVLAGGILALASVSHAATVTWGAAQTVTGDSDVSTAGTLVAAFNVGGVGVGNTTVNGTTFTGLALSGTSVTSGNFNFSSTASFVANNAAGSASAPFSNLSAPYQALLSSLVGNTITTPFTLTMSGLTAGATYQFEWWTNSSFANGAIQTAAAAGNSVTLNANNLAGPGGIGQFALGTFIADGTMTQTITFSAVNSNQALLDGFQLRALPASAVPEPGSALAGMLALGVCFGGLVKRSRRQTVEA